VNLRSTGVLTTIDTSDGTDDMVNVGSLAPATGGDLLGIAAVVKVDDQDSASLNLDDSGDPTGRSITIGQLGGLTGILVSGLPNITLTVNIAEVTYTGGTGDDTFHAVGFLAQTKVSLNGGGGNDVLKFAPIPLDRIVSFDGGTGTNGIDYSLIPRRGVS